MSETAMQKQDRQDLVHSPEQAFFTPLVDIIETGEAFIFQADLPGVKSEDLEVTYQNNILTIQGKAKPRQSARYLWQEYGVGTFYRQFTLNAPIDVDAIKADLKNGVLELHVPKSESARTRKIQIRSS